MNAALFKALVALVPAGILFIGSVFLFLEEGLSALSYSCSTQGVWSFSLIHAKHFMCSLGCDGAQSIASGTTSTSRVLSLVTLCFR
jgi:hypothetical protein